MHRALKSPVLQGEITLGWGITTNKSDLGWEVAFYWDGRNDRIFIWWFARVLGAFVPSKLQTVQQGQGCGELVCSLSSVPGRMRAETNLFSPCLWMAGKALLPELITSISWHSLNSINYLCNYYSRRKKKTTHQEPATALKKSFLIYVSGMCSPNNFKKVSAVSAQIKWCCRVWL